MSYVFLVPKNSIFGLKNVISGHFSVHFRWNFHRKKNFEHFYSTKRFFIDFQGSLLSYFWAILFIFAFITILEDFGGLLPARTVTVNSCHTEEQYLMPYGLAVYCQRFEITRKDKLGSKNDSLNAFLAVSNPHIHLKFSKFSAHFRFTADQKFYPKKNFLPPMDTHQNFS